MLSPTIVRKMRQFVDSRARPGNNHSGNTDCGQPGTGTTEAMDKLAPDALTLYWNTAGRRGGGRQEKG
jgi:hypothetical protein